MNCIVAVDSNWAIGNKGQLLVSIPADHKFFRQETLHKIIVYGRKTLATFPLSQPLDRRENIILSHDEKLVVRGATVAHSIEEVLELVKGREEEVYIIGGAQVYKEFLPYCDVCTVTKVDKEFEADAYFPNLDEDPAFVMTEESDEQTYFDLCYTFTRYERKK